MPDSTLLRVFVAASLVVLLMPGLGVLFVVARGPWPCHPSGCIYVGLGVNAALAERQA